MQVDNDGTAVPMAPGQDVESSGDEDEDMDADDDEAMQERGDAQEQQAPTNGASCSSDAAAAERLHQKAAPVIDDDGFQLVQRGRRRR